MKEGDEGYLALHEWTSIDAFQSREYRYATTTPWRMQVLKEDRVVGVSNSCLQSREKLGSV